MHRRIKIIVGGHESVLRFLAGNRPPKEDRENTKKHHGRKEKIDKIELTHFARWTQLKHQRLESAVSEAQSP